MGGRALPRAGPSEPRPETLDDGRDRRPRPRLLPLPARRASLLTLPLPRLDGALSVYRVDTAGSRRLIVLACPPPAATSFCVRYDPGGVAEGPIPRRCSTGGTRSYEHPSSVILLQLSGSLELGLRKFLRRRTAGRVATRLRRCRNRLAACVTSAARSPSPGGVPAGPPTSMRAPQSWSVSLSGPRCALSMSCEIQGWHVRSGFWLGPIAAVHPLSRASRSVIQGLVGVGDHL